MSRPRSVFARGWQATVDRQRDERLDRTRVSRTSTISGALANYENALQTARSLWLASDGVSRPEFNTWSRPATPAGPSSATGPCSPATWT